MQISTVQPVFKLELNHKVTPNIVTIAKYDGTHPCLTACAGYDKVWFDQYVAFSCNSLNNILISLSKIYSFYNLKN